MLWAEVGGRFQQTKLVGIPRPDFVVVRLLEMPVEFFEFGNVGCEVSHRDVIVVHILLVFVEPTTEFAPNLSLALSVSSELLIKSNTVSRKLISQRGEHFNLCLLPDVVVEVAVIPLPVMLGDGINEVVKIG